MAEANTGEIRRVAVIGAGTIGAGWTACFLARGLDVTVYDPEPDAAQSVGRFVASAWPLLERLGLAAGASPDRWRFQPDLAASVDAAEFVQENTPERYEVKIDLLRRLDRYLPREIVVASSSAGLLISRMQERCDYAERFVIGHPLNPPHLMPLVEVVGGFKTAQRTIQIALEFYRTLGKVPVELRREGSGHLADRLQTALWREAVRLVAEGVATVADIDTAISEGPGLRWALFGAHLTAALESPGGMASFIDRIGASAMNGNGGMTPELREILLRGVEQELGDRAPEALLRQRDEFLVRLLEARRDAERRR
jgi:3-hydroxyacyl-CoA dehydrogenase